MKVYISSLANTFYLAYVTENKEEKMEPILSNKLESPSWIVLYGPPKVGKTGTAATASEFCPATLPSKESVELSDMVWLNYDTGGMESLADLNLVAPTFDLSHAASWGDAVRQETKIFEYIQKRAKESQDKFFLVVDTLSSRDLMLNTHFQNEFSDKPKLTSHMYNNIFSANLNFLFKLRTLPAHVGILILMHAKGTVNYTQDTGASSTQVASQAEITDISPQLTGKAKDAVLKDSTLFWLQKRVVKGRPTVREVLTRSTDLIQAGGRGENRLEMYEPANLKTIFKKMGR